MNEKLQYELGTGHFLNSTYAEAAVFARYAETVVAAFSEAKNEIAILCDRIGSYHKTTGNLDKALGFFEEYKRLKKELYDADPNNVPFKNGLAISYEKLGDTHTALGNLDQALRFFEDENDLFKKLYGAYPNNVAFKNGLAVSYIKLGSIFTPYAEPGAKAQISAHQSL
ncbi:MAG: tetratricopeptide repeat protein [bacterium]